MDEKMQRRGLPSSSVSSSVPDCHRGYMADMITNSRIEIEISLPQKEKISEEKANKIYLPAGTNSSVLGVLNPEKLCLGGECRKLEPVSRLEFLLVYPSDDGNTKSI